MLHLNVAQSVENPAEKLVSLVLSVEFGQGAEFTARIRHVGRARPPREFSVDADPCLFELSL